jgi:hypothetical protein
VLAAEEFGVPAPDPALADTEAHDVLAAEEFAVPAPDPTLHHPPVVLPADLTGAEEPRDVLAAEEFAMPAPPPHPAGLRVDPSSMSPWVPRAVVALLLLAAVSRLRHR